MKIGVREFCERLSHWIDRAIAGDEIVVTERGRPSVRLTAVEPQTTRERLIADGVITPAKRSKGSVPLPKPVPINGTIDDILRDSRGRY